MRSESIEQKRDRSNRDQPIPGDLSVSIDVVPGGDDADQLDPEASGSYVRRSFSRAKQSGEHSHMGETPIVQIDDVIGPVVLTRFDGMQVSATCKRFDRDYAKSKIDLKWWSEQKIDRNLKKEEPDKSWTWHKEIGSARNLYKGNIGCWAVETEDGKVQGAHIYTTSAVSLLSKGSAGEKLPAVYGHCLATAPWNRDRLAASGLGLYRGVGTALMRVAIAHSFLSGGEGRVVLTSAIHPETIEWYEEFGFVRPVSPDHATIVFELPVGVAEIHLAEMGLI